MSLLHVPRAAVTLRAVGRLFAEMGLRNPHTICAEALRNFFPTVRGITTLAQENSLFLNPRAHPTALRNKVSEVCKRVLRARCLRLLFPLIAHVLSARHAMSTKCYMVGEKKPFPNCGRLWHRGCFYMLWFSLETTSLCTILILY